MAGQMKALDTPRNFIMSKGAIRVTYTYIENDMECTGSCQLDEIKDDELLNLIISENRLKSIHSTEPTLNDIFIEITGAKLC